MIWRWKLKFLAKITLLPSKLHSFAAVHHLASPIKLTSGSNPQNPLPSKSVSNQEQLEHTPKSTFLSPETVLTTLQNCPSDLIALSIFLWCARQPDYFHDKPTFRHMVSVVSNLTQRYGTVKAIVEELKTVGCVTKAQTLLLLMRIYWCGAMYDMVVETFEEMSNYGYTPNTYAQNIIMDVFFKIEHVDAALRVLEETQSPNFLSFNIAICNLCRLNDVNNVKVVLRCMLMKGYYMNPETYTLVLNCFCKFGRLEEALQLLSMMTVLGLPISVNIWSILIDGFCKSGQIEVAAYLLEKMVEIGCSPNIVTYTSLIKGFLESDMPEKAFEILGTLKSTDLVLSNVLIDCLSKIGKYEDAFKVFSSLRERKLTPDVYTYSSLVSTICLSRQFVHLPLLTSGLPIQPDLVVCNCLLSYFCKSGLPECAVEFYDDMIESGFQPDKYSFTAVLSALFGLGRIHKAFHVYNGISRTHSGIDAHIHTVIINGLIRSGSFHKAMRLFRKAAAEKFPLDVVSYNVAINGLIRGGKMEEAYSLFGQMKEMDVAPDKHSYNMILCGFCKNRDVNMIVHVVQEMVDRNIKLEFKTCKLMINLGLLPKLSVDNYDFGTSSSEDLSDAVALVG